MVATGFGLLYETIVVTAADVALGAEGVPRYERLARLNREFGDIVASGAIERIDATPSEVDDDDVVDLPRLAFRFDRRNWARVRELIDAVNEPYRSRSAPA